MGTEFHHAAVLDHADAIGMAHGRKAVRNENRGATAGGGEHAIEDFGFAADVKLRGGFVEQDDSGTEFYGGERACKGNALPLAAREISAAVIALC